MALTIDDLKPKPFTVNIRGVEVECKPLKLSHTLELTKIGRIFEAPEDYAKTDYKNAETDFQKMVTELMPELKDIEVDAKLAQPILEQMLDSIEPTDSKALKEAGVKFDKDPKVPKTG